MSRLLVTLLLSTFTAAPSTPSPALGPPSVERLAQLVADDVQAQSPEAPVAIHLSGASPEMRRALGTLLASRLAALELGPFVLEAPTPEAAEELARDKGARALVRLTLSLQEGALHARGDVLGTWVNFWSGRTPSRPPGPAAAVTRAVEADAGALALASVSPQGMSSATPMTVTSGPRQVRLMGAVLVQLDQPPAALAAGDLDGDGRDEVAVLTHRAVSVYAGDGRLLARRDIEGIPLSATPPREPFGVVAVLPQPPRLAAWSAHFAHGEVLLLDRAKGTLRPIGTLDTAPLGTSERASFTPGRTTFAPEVRVDEGQLLSVPAPFVSASLAPPQLLFVHADGSGSLYPRATTPPIRMQGLGAGSALGDLDGDGKPELLTTSPQLFPSPDTLRVHALVGDDPLAHNPLWQSTLPVGRALQVVTADLDLDHRREVLVGLWHLDGTGEVFLMRQGTP
ncbi:FG-GAP repeat domain-containing protein [Stigmatella aurantiaca]|uniref:FG-GAP repeat domain protein n=1 Tax=Stigmatella aurantiaca (strain DW4/3-1) TaxID=378806 RepID=Q091F8_STIAD|nr:VCBS repeat-containing protein [Stigmatella aurantiaca]ADO73695.1 FG-GAP repeat domain protein [Stigmatella aurantiaca DW4/3-1]EAU66370.1 FG-GAP repeat domain protein [Stigmatella aurantiaca DW4/3-1]